MPVFLSEKNVCGGEEKSVIYDLQDFSEDHAIKSDVCIIGGGAAGLAIALELNHTPYQIVVLESGGSYFEGETQALYDIVNIGESLRQTPTRIRALGGTLNVWGGALVVLDDIDFEKRSWIPHSGWPITYAEVETYWRIAAERYHLPPFHAYKLDHWLPNIKITDERKLLHTDTCIKITNFSDKPLNLKTDYHHELATSRNIHIYLHANATHLSLNNSCQSMQAIEAKPIKGNSLTCEANYFVLAAGGIENAALLLNSRDQMPKGVGNQNGLVGRFYMDHPKGDFGILRPLHKGMQLPHFWGTGTPYGRVRMGVSLSRELMQRERLLNHRIRLIRVRDYEGLPGIRPSRTLRKRFRESPTRSAQAIRNRLRDHRLLSSMRRYAHNTLNHLPKFGRLEYMLVQNYLEQVPNPDSRVFLSDKSDIFGNKQATLDWKISSMEKESIKKFHDILRCCFKSIGQLHSNFEEVDQWPIAEDASHHMGTTRMALHEKEGVVDKDCKMFGVDNLFVAGSSVFPTGGHANPTFTILALSLRLADHLKRKLS